MIYKQWEIILLPFPFTDLSKTKKRPALIISPNEYNKSGDVVIAFITSNMKVSARIGDYKIKSWKRAGLPKPSLIRMKFATVSENIVIKKIGRLQKNDVEKFREQLNLLLGSI